MGKRHNIKKTSRTSLSLIYIYKYILYYIPSKNRFLCPYANYFAIRRQIYESFVIFFGFCICIKYLDELITTIKREYLFIRYIFTNL